MNKLQGGLVNFLRTTGQALDGLGRKFEVNPFVEKFQPSIKVVKFGSSTPTINGAFIAPGATVIGKVNIGAKSSVWYGAVVRGDVNTISIGDGVSVGDRAMIHCSGSTNHPTSIGNNVTIGAGAILHGCSVSDEVIIGPGAQILDGAKIGKQASISAGSIVTQGKVVPSGQLWSGVPASYVRELTSAEKDAIVATAIENVELAVVYASECAKTWMMIEEEEYISEQTLERADYYFQRLTKEEMAKREGDVQGHQVPGRVFDSPIRTSFDPRLL